jgi:SAM-dependent methyltransferase
MPKLPDLNDPRYLHEIGWFLYHDRYERDGFGGSYDQERLAYSKLFLEEVIELCGLDRAWFQDKTVVTIGCGCTGDLSTWPAAVKIGVDPLLHVYQELGMLVQDQAGTAPTTFLSVPAEDLPILAETVDLIVCRNALDHMPDPALALAEISRVLRDRALFFLSVDLGGEPTPDEPTVFSHESLASILEKDFELLTERCGQAPHSIGRESSVRIVARKRDAQRPRLDKESILRNYLKEIGINEMT